MKIGSLLLESLVDGAGHEDPREVLFRPEIPGDPWDDHTELLTAEGNLELSVGGYLIRTGDRNILVDAGVGTIDNGKYRGGQFLESLKSHGLDPADITDVVFTHLHFDHVGWATKKGAVVFENATYRVHKLDWEHFVESPGAEPGAVRKLKPLESRLELFAGDLTLAPGLDARHTPGHTPGSTTFIVSSEGQRAALTALVSWLASDQRVTAVHIDVAVVPNEREMLHGRVVVIDVSGPLGAEPPQRRAVERFASVARAVGLVAEAEVTGENVRVELRHEIR